MRDIGRRLGVGHRSISCAGRTACRQWSLGSLASACARLPGKAADRKRSSDYNQRDRPSLAHGHDACMSPQIMRSIIRQNANQPVLPDFRNLGTILRILVAVNGGAALVRLGARRRRRAAMFAELTLATTVVEPYLFLVLAVLWLASPRLARLPFATGAGVVELLTMIAGIVLFASVHLLGRSRRRRCSAGSLWALLAVRRLVFYFHLRARALSPAITEARLAGVAGADPPAFPVQQHQCGAVAGAQASPRAPRSRCRTWRTCFAC